MLKPSKLKPEQEAHEYIRDKKDIRFCHYYYKHANGQLYSCIKRLFKSCVQARKDWVDSL